MFTLVPDTKKSPTGRVGVKNGGRLPSWRPDYSPNAKTYQARLVSGHGRITNAGTDSCKRSDLDCLLPRTTDGISFSLSSGANSKKSLIPPPVCPRTSRLSHQHHNYVVGLRFCTRIAANERALSYKVGKVKCLVGSTR